MPAELRHQNCTHNVDLLHQIFNISLLYLTYIAHRYFSGSMVDKAGKEGSNYQNKHKGYPCDHCQYSADKSSIFKRHKGANHEGIRYPCDQCEYSAAHIRNLKRHTEVFDILVTNVNILQVIFVS